LGTADVSRRHDYKVNCFTYTLLVNFTISCIIHDLKFRTILPISYFMLETLYVALLSHVNVSFLFQSSGKRAYKVCTVLGSGTR